MEQHTGKFEHQPGEEHVSSLQQIPISIMVKGVSFFGEKAHSTQKGELVLVWSTCSAAVCLRGLEGRWMFNGH